MKDTWPNRRKIALSLVDEIRKNGYERLQSLNLGRPLNQYNVIKELLNSAPNNKAFNLLSRRLVKQASVPPIRSLLNTGESVIQRAIVRQKHKHFMEDPNNLITASTPSYSIETRKQNLTALSPILYNLVTQFSVSDTHMNKEIQIQHFIQYAIPKLRENIRSRLSTGPQKIEFYIQMVVHVDEGWGMERARVGDGVTDDVPTEPLRESEYSEHYTQEAIREAMENQQYDPKHMPI